MEKSLPELHDLIRYVFNNPLPKVKLLNVLIGTDEEKIEVAWTRYRQGKKITNCLDILTKGQN